MPVLCTFLIISLIGNFEARQPDIDINRVKLLPKEAPRLTQPSSHGRRSINEVYQFSRNNDYDDHSSGLYQWRAPMHILHDANTLPNKKAIKIHQPREDPRLFYQSEEYLKKIVGKDLNNEVSHIYPGTEVIRAEEKSQLKSIEPHYVGNRIEDNLIEDNLCVRCPHDRTLIAKPGSDRVVLQYPRLQSCSLQRKLPRNIRFVHMYGPNFGYLLEQGSYVVVGRITYKNKPLQICKMQVHVLIQNCPTPKSLIANCDKEHKKCNFKCRDPKQDLHGEATLVCEDNMKWSGNIPFCKDRTWCEPPPPPDHGRLTCKGSNINSGTGFLEGATCRARCNRGWRWTPRAAAVCRHGAWSHSLSCQPKRN